LSSETAQSDEIIFPFAKRFRGNGLEVPMPRHPRQLDVRPDVLLARNLRALLHARRVDDSALAAWCGHKPAWLSKILNGERGLRVKELGRVADFFGVEVAVLFQYGIDAVLERRKYTRRMSFDRRQIQDRRQSLSQHDAGPASLPIEGTVVHAPALLPPSSDPVQLAEQLTVLAERLKDAATAVLTRYAATLGDLPADRPESDHPIRRTSGSTHTRRTG